MNRAVGPLELDLLRRGPGKLTGQAVGRGNLAAQKVETEDDIGQIMGMRSRTSQVVGLKKFTTKKRGVVQAKKWRAVGVCSRTRGSFKPSTGLKTVQARHGLRSFRSGGSCIPGSGTGVVKFMLLVFGSYSPGDDEE